MITKKHITILFLLLCNLVHAQTDSLSNEFNREFESFQESIEQEITTFEIQNDSTFIKFLQGSWREFKIFDHVPPPVRPKPQGQPVIRKGYDTTRQKLDYKGIIKPDTTGNDNQPQLEESKPPDYRSRAVIKSFDIYGVSTEVQYYPDKLPHFTSMVNEQSIIEFYRDLSSGSSIWDYNLSEFKKIKEACSFNDWGYYIILMKAAENIFSNKNEQTLFIWYALIKSGYRIKIGYNDNHLYLLLPSRQKLYNIQYLAEDGMVYYLFQNGQTKPVQITTYPGFYMAGAKIFSFALNELPKLNSGPLIYRRLAYNQAGINLAFNSGTMGFLNGYPQCALNAYFSTSMSGTNIDALDQVFLPLFEGKTNREKINILLNFIQTSVGYKTDWEQFGRERYMFAEECLYYPYSDCEDRAVLLGQLVKHFTGLPIIGLEFTDHVTLAVLSPDEDYGYHIMYEGNKYIICDPTFINGKAGMVPKDLKKGNPRIIVF